MAVDRPVGDEEINAANSPLRASFGPWVTWNVTHTASSHNQTYQDQEFLRRAWGYLTSLSGRNTLASDNFAHFLSGTGTSKRLNLNQLFQQDGGVTNEFNSRVASQIQRAETAYKMLKQSSGLSLEDFLKRNLRQYADKPRNNPADFVKDYGQSPGPYDGHVEVDQGAFLNDNWKNATGGLSILWIYLGTSRTNSGTQHRVSAFCLKRYKWHPFEWRPTQLVHIAAENAKTPSVNISKSEEVTIGHQWGGPLGSVGAVGMPKPPTSGPIELGSTIIGHWKDDGKTTQTIYNPAKEYLLIFPPVDRIVPAYVPTRAGGVLTAV
ncbi:hypothetical protein G6L37_13375 [Agrobacterium rubi]|uniref:hypothetical protein n=1 Tax=Agrobacterium rubi TaxID=28099 RepID=UPI001571797B|nr:hypothetical protein [Agrobacterium rubi]NTF07138.1 hypothetical protein [Agrobacterium rubi]NTF19394.1 hypothetical protein [Agrobacterium rubi]NTF26357.1 hypothetical protein [Agrobacterium rubi]